jgi:hypothetical protein
MFRGDVVKNIGMENLSIFKTDKVFLSERNIPINNRKIWMRLGSDPDTDLVPYLLVLLVFVSLRADPQVLTEFNSDCIGSVFQHKIFTRQKCLFEVF